MELEYPETVIRTRSEHCISRKNIDRDALTVLYRLSRNGFVAHLVGGGVRDLLLGREPKDFDVGTNAQPRQIKRLFRNCFLIGRRFRLAHVRFQDKIIETSTFRRQPDFLEDPNDPDADLFHKRDNTFGTPIEDARRRDFTINGLFYDIRTFCVIDHVGGLEDLDRRLIRSIGDANIRFREDPVRMLRAVRFASRLGFTIENDTNDAIMRYRAEIMKASPPRLIEEIYRLFAFKSGKEAMRILRDTGLMAVLFPEVDAWLEESNAEDHFWSLLEALDAGAHAVGCPTPALIFGTLYLPLFQEMMQRAWEEGGNVNAADMARDVIQPVAERFQMPKAVFFRVLQMFQGQQRLEPSRRQRFSKPRFMAQEGFAEILALYEIGLAGGYGGQEAGATAASWRDLFEEFRSKQEQRAACEAPASDEPESGRPRKAPGRGRGNDDQPGAAQLDADDAGAAPKRRRRRRGGRNRHRHREAAPASAEA